MSVTSSEKRAHRTPSLLVAAIPAVTLIVLLGGGYIAASLPVEPLLIASAVVAGIVAMTLGYTWDEIIGAIAEKIAKTMPAILILIVVGALIGTWMAGGTIPMLIYYGLKIINPQFLALIALVVTAIVSLCTGTSWGSAGTIGVAFMGVAVGMDANLPMVAGAIVAGAYFGDKLSPLSDTTNIASLATGVNLFTHIRHLMWTTIPAFLTSAVVYLFVVAPIAGVFGFTLHSLAHLSAGVVALAGLAGTASYLFYYKALSAIGASRGMALNISYSAWAIIFALVLQGTVPTATQVVCCVVILVGTVLAATPSWGDLLPRRAEKVSGQQP